MPSSPEKERFAKYQNDSLEDFFSIGRLGKFFYQGMPEAVGDAIDGAAML